MQKNQVKFNDKDLVKINSVWLKNNPQKNHFHPDHESVCIKVNDSFHILNKDEKYRIFSIGVTGSWLVVKDEDLEWITVDCDDFREIFIKV
ncbi:hypothetical protein [Photorhabdus hindustanensis]|uniref:Uncharacterized protein n=1 Tax=Photorhabdus hindustanensis TaxID=2918802 RepID=A0A2S8PV87_9GAMM|nr:hypothetical protein [Photorhabdus hindustanensis]PQQ22790.1 hypothetical protein C6H66_22145 [Photorhabdus hindustanensis]